MNNCSRPTVYQSLQFARLPNRKNSFFSDIVRFSATVAETRNCDSIWTQTTRLSFSIQKSSFYTLESDTTVGCIGAATVGVVGVRTLQNFGRGCPTPPTLWQVHTAVWWKYGALFVKWSIIFLSWSATGALDIIVLFCKISKETEWGMKRKIERDLYSRWLATSNVQFRLNQKYYSGRRLTFCNTLCQSASDYAT